MNDLEFLDEILDEDNISSNDVGLEYLDEILELDENELESNDDCEVLDSDFIDTHFIPVNSSTIENFPIVENDFDAITDYELFSKGIGYLEEVKADRSELSDYVKKDEIPPLDDFVTKDTTELENYTLTSDLSEVALTGDYDDLTNKPVIPDVSNYVTKDTTELENYTLTNDLSEVALTGDYDDLSNKPIIPDVSNYVTKDTTELENYTLTSDLSSVALSGDYDDLINKPTIPDVSNFITKDVDNLTNYYDKTTIQSRESSIVNLIPTKTSDLQNDSNFITLSDVPTNLSSYVNDEGFITNTVSNLTNYTTTSALTTLLSGKEDSIDIGSNTNGYYIKFSDGTLIMYGHATNGSSGYATITFPVTLTSSVNSTLMFCTKAYRSGSTLLINYFATCQVNTATSGYIYLRDVNNNAITSSEVIAWLVIGKWK